LKNEPLPLPDTPGLGPYRHPHPTTAEYDRQHNRSANYWLDFDPNQVNSVMKKSFAVFNSHRPPAEPEA
jgi:hypothetical protein